MTPRNATTPRMTKGSSHSHPDPRGKSSAEKPLSTALSEVQLLEEEVRNLAEGIDGLEEQRRLMHEVVHTSCIPEPSEPTRHGAASPSDASSQKTAVHGDSDTQHDVAELRVQLERVRDEAARREAELLAEIAVLRDALSQRAEPPAPPVITLLDGDDAEQSMDLGTPLVPVTVLWGKDGDTVTILNQQLPADGREENAKETRHVELTGQSQDDQANNRDEDLALHIPLPPSPDASFEDPGGLSQPVSLSLHHRPPTPFALNASQADTEPDVQAIDAPVETLPASSTPVASNCACAERLLSVECELEETKQAIATRDAELVELRKAVNELRMATLRK